MQECAVSYDLALQANLILVRADFCDQMIELYFSPIAILSPYVKGSLKWCANEIWHHATFTTALSFQSTDCALNTSNLDLVSHHFLINACVCCRMMLYNSDMYLQMKLMCILQVTTKPNLVMWQLLMLSSNRSAPWQSDNSFVDCIFCFEFHTGDSNCLLCCSKNSSTSQQFTTCIHQTTITRWHVMQIVARIKVGARPVHLYSVNQTSSIWSHSDAEGSFYVIPVNNSQNLTVTRVVPVSLKPNHIDLTPQTFFNKNLTDFAQISLARYSWHHEFVQVLRSLWAFKIQKFIKWTIMMTCSVRPHQSFESVVASWLLFLT